MDLGPINRGLRPRREAGYHTANRPCGEAGYNMVNRPPRRSRRGRFTVHTADLSASVHCWS